MTFSRKPSLIKLPPLRLAAWLLAACLLAACQRTAEPSGPPEHPANPLREPPIAKGAVPAAATTATAAVAAPTQLAAALPVTADITVGRNDTLDRIFRKLKLNLTDLANLRALPGIRTHMDNLRL